MSLIESRSEGGQNRTCIKGEMTKYDYSSGGAGPIVINFFLKFINIVIILTFYERQCIVKNIYTRMYCLNTDINPKKCLHELLTTSQNVCFEPLWFRAALHAVGQFYTLVATV